MKLSFVSFSLRRWLKQTVGDGLWLKIGLGRCLPLWWRGYSTEQIWLYDLTRATCDRYPPDLYRYRVTVKTNQPLWPVLHDKLFFDSFMRGRLPIIEARGVWGGGRYGAVPGGWEEGEWMALLKQGRKMVIKAVQGGGGLGLLFLQDGDETGLKVNGERMDWRQFADLAGRLEYHGLYPFVQQHPVLADFFAETVNTLRVTVYGGKGGARLFAPVLRVGCRASIPVDNFQMGGLTVAIDEVTGMTVRACLRGVDGRRVEVERHPESGQPLLGVKIPFWSEIREMLLAFHERQPGFDLVGWDVLVGGEGFWIIEGNHNPGMRMVFLFRTFAEEPEFRQFFVEQGILPQPI